MANNTYINEIIFGNSTLINLKNDTVAPEYLFKGITAHMADGSIITGTAEVKVEGTKLIMPEGLISIS